jgi:ABC-type branched-subunit amino acid transport system ATPase component/branched-subunit amino acid ABC-type transport system permease component
MQEFIKFAILGLGVGALYALASQGLMVIYRGSGVLNFGHGAVGMVGAYFSWELRSKQDWPFILALLFGVALSALIGALTHLVVMRQLRKASPLARIVATLGVLIILQSAAVVRYGGRVTFVQTELPDRLYRVGDITIALDRIILVIIAVVLTFVLWAFYKFTNFGLATSGVAENQRAAAAIGLSPDKIATINWAIGSALAGLAAILVSPIVTLQVTTMTNLVLAALAAALVAGFRSFPVALIAGLLIGVGQTELVNYVSTPGISQSFPFLVIIAVMVFRGTALPVRGYFLQRLPAVGDGKVRVTHVAIGVVVSLILITQLPTLWQDSMVTTFAMATILLSIVVVTGYAGQLSLGQYALAGLGAFIAGRAIDVWNFPFLLSIPFALIVIAPLGALFALPAVRARGLNLAIVTLGLGSAIQLIIFGNSKWTGGFIGTKIGKPSIFGWDISATRNPSRYAIVCMVGFILAALAVAAMRRGRSGRRLLAVRTNERAAAALGISVVGAKLYAFAVGAAIAGLGGILISFRKDTILFSSEFNNFVSVTSVGWAFLGGIGWLMGPIFGATLTPGSIGARVSNSIFSGIEQYVQLIGGVFVVLIVLLNQDGIAKESAMQVKWIGSKLKGLVKKPNPNAEVVVEKVVLPPETRDRVAPVTLRVDGLTVRYGGVTAVEDVTLQVPPGKITGLIGPNGAGKTSFIDAVTGFTRAAAGSITLDDHDVTKLNAPKRARLGMSRSFHSLELFEDLSVLDNLRAASDPRDQLSYFTDLFWPVNPPLPGSVVAAINEFGLEDDLLRKVEDLSYGNRRLLAIARAVATQPNVLLLDEPAAGLGDAETAELATLVRRLADEWGMSILLVEHDMNFVMSVCDNIVVLDFGRKIAEGTPEEIQSNPLVVAAYLGGEHADH